MSSKILTIQPILKTLPRLSRKFCSKRNLRLRYLMYSVLPWKNTKYWRWKTFASCWSTQLATGFALMRFMLTQSQWKGYSKKSCPFVSIHLQSIHFFFTSTSQIKNPTLSEPSFISSSAFMTVRSSSTRKFGLGKYLPKYHPIIWDWVLSRQRIVAEIIPLWSSRTPNPIT